MNYPIELRTFENNLQLYVPIFDKLKPIYEKERLINPSTPSPLWAKIWASSMALSAFLLDHIDIVEHKNIVEIGAGIGLPSFSISRYVNSIIISDYSLDAIALINKNISHLALQNTFASVIDWNTTNVTIDCDVLLFSDINYDASQFGALTSFINYCLDHSCTIIIATPNRIISSPFMKQFSDMVKKDYHVTINENNTMIEIGIFILKR